MKNLTKKLAITIYVFLSHLLVCYAQQNVSIFNKPVSLDAPMVTDEYAAGFPLSVDASHVRKCVALGVSTHDLTEVFDAVSSHINGGFMPAGTPVIGGLFTTEFGNDTLAVFQNQTHGFSFAFHRDTLLTLYYFEVNPQGGYDLVENLTTRINSYSEDLFLSLHYSHFSPGTYPDNSTIFSFICDTLGRVGYADSSDVSVALSKDYERQAGLFPLGMADSVILTGLERPNNRSRECNNPCPQATANTRCLEITDMTGTTWHCVTDLGDCAAGATERRAREENIDLGVDFKFKKMRDFRDRFMSAYCEGRKYTGFYYTFSKYAKLNIAMLWKYAAVLPEIYDAMDNLADTVQDKIIITTSLKAKVLEILNDHRDVGDSYFQSILREVSADLETYEGMERSVLLGLLAPYGSCGQQRTINPDSQNNAAYFVSAFSNPGKDDLVVNYFVRGNKVKIELFNAASGLVATINNSEPRKKLHISTAGLLPGIYLYRISTDEGYEKVGKVAVVK